MSVNKDIRRKVVRFSKRKDLETKLKMCNESKSYGERR